MSRNRHSKFDYLCIKTYRRYTAPSMGAGPCNTDCGNCENINILDVVFLFATVTMIGNRTQLVSHCAAHWSVFNILTNFQVDTQLARTSVKPRCSLLIEASLFTASSMSAGKRKKRTVLSVNETTTNTPHATSDMRQTRQRST